MPVSAHVQRKPVYAGKEEISACYHECREVCDWKQGTDVSMIMKSNPCVIGVSSRSCMCDCSPLLMHVYSSELEPVTVVTCKDLFNLGDIYGLLTARALHHDPPKIDRSTIVASEHALQKNMQDCVDLSNAVD
jgi:hypothetical protein